MKSLAACLTLTAMSLTSLPLSARAEEAPTSLSADAQAALAAAMPAPDAKVSLGFGRLFDNDALGDLHDRWHTGSYSISDIRGPYWRGTLPTVPFQILEFRITADTIAPEDLVAPAPDDRRYAGSLSLGVHTQFDWHGLETNVGADLVATGPQTGISQFQSWVHNALGMDAPTVFGDQIENGFYPTLTAELGKGISLGPTTTLRPFAAAEVGVETWARAGADLTFGHFGEGALMLRDTVTGQRYRAVAGDLVPGLSLTMGGDVAYVLNSAYLPAGEPAVLSDTRTRLRVGMQWQGEKNAVFYGLTWLGPEFDSQPTGQVVSSLNVQIRF